MFTVWGILGYLGGKARSCGEVCVASVWLKLDRVCCQPVCQYMYCRVASSKNPVQFP